VKLSTRQRLLAWLVILAVIVAVFGAWARSVIGHLIPWAACFEIPDSASRADEMRVLGPPTCEGDYFWQWNGSNGVYLIQFDNGRMIGRAQQVDPHAGINRLWRTCCLPAEWLPYVVELSRQ
jgi:hypothetical protein